MSSYIITYKGGVQIVTHSSGLTNVYTQDELKEHKKEIRLEVKTYEAEIIEIDKQIKLCKGETLIAKVLHIFRKDRTV